MYSCEQVRELLPQYIADGEPQGREFAELRQHVSLCRRCQAYVEALRLVERALRTYPRVYPDPALRGQILAAVAREADAAQERWQWLPWDVWVPAAAVAAALVIAAMGFAPYFNAASLQEWEAALQEWSLALGQWFFGSAIPLSANALWAIWGGIFAITAGVGISLGLAGWNKAHAAQLDDLEARISEAANRLLGYARRAH